MSNIYRHPVIDIYPWPNGLGFRGAEEWWSYVRRQTEEDKLDLLITMAHLSDQICASLLAHDQALFERFQLSPQIITRLCAVHADSLCAFASALVEQNDLILKGGNSL